MKLYIKQHIFSWGDKFSVYDADGAVCYTVKGEVFTFGKKLHVYRDEDEVAFIEQELFRFLPHYHMSLSDGTEATVAKNFSFFRPSYTVEGLHWQVKGDFFSHDYEITDEGGAPIANVYKEWFTLGDAYAIDILADQAEQAALCVALIIDAVISASRD